MAKMTVKGIDEFRHALIELGDMLVPKVIGPAVYTGADIVMDAVRTEFSKIPTDESWGTESKPIIGPPKVQKKGIYESLGISHMQDDGTGFWNVKIGVSGYNEVRTKTWPKGQPNPMVARAINSGTSFMAAHPFYKTAVQKSRKKAQDAMKRKASDEIRRAFWARRGK